MKQTMLLFCAVGASIAAVFAGCASVYMSSPGSLAGVDVKGAAGGADRVINISNDGYYLFQRWPLASGNIAWNEKEQDVEHGFKLFSDQLKGDRMLNAMCRYADSQGCDIVDVVVNNKDTCDVSLSSIAGVFNTIVGYRCMSYSAVLRKRGEVSK